MVCQGCWLVDGDEGSAVVDPHQLGVLEVVGESFGVGRGHELVVSRLDDEDRVGDGALLVGPLEQLPGLRDDAAVATPSPSVTVSHSVPFINTPCSSTTTGPSPPVSEYMRPAAVGPLSGICGPPRRWAS